MQRGHSLILDFVCTGILWWIRPLHLPAVLLHLSCDKIGTVFVLPREAMIRILQRNLNFKYHFHLLISNTACTDVHAQQWVVLWDYSFLRKNVCYFSQLVSRLTYVLHVEHPRSWYVLWDDFHLISVVVTKLYNRFFLYLNVMRFSYWIRGLNTFCLMFWFH